MDISPKAPSGDKQIYHGPFEIEALGKLSLSSRSDECILQATGPQAHLQLESASYASMSCGSALLGMSNLPDPNGQIVLSTEATGSIVQSLGKVGPEVKLSPGMITLSVGLPGQGASITLTPLSVEIKVGMISFTLTPQGISEMVGVVQRDMTVAGFKVQAGAETTLNVGMEGLTESGLLKKADFSALAAENGGAIMSIKGGIVKINCPDPA